jgi:hypothetical protein
MKLKLILTVAAIYLGLVGIGLLLAPTFMVLGLPDAASPILVAQLRAMSDVFIGVAVVDWLARNAEASRALNAIILGNTAGFGMSVILGIGVVLAGNEVVSWIFTGLSLFCLVGFIVVGRANTSTT